jgi:hypothetical protein
VKLTALSAENAESSALALQAALPIGTGAWWLVVVVVVAWCCLVHAHLMSRTQPSEQRSSPPDCCSPLLCLACVLLSHRFSSSPPPLSSTGLRRCSNSDCTLKVPSYLPGKVYYFYHRDTPGSTNIRSVGRYAGRRGSWPKLKPREKVGHHVVG